MTIFIAVIICHEAIQNIIKGTQGCTQTAEVWIIKVKEVPASIEEVKLYIQ